MTRYEVTTIETEHYDTTWEKNPQYPYKTTNTWIVYDKYLTRVVKRYKVPLISLWLASRLAKKLNKQGGKDD